MPSVFFDIFKYEFQSKEPGDIILAKLKWSTQNVLPKVEGHRTPIV